MSVSLKQFYPTTCPSESDCKESCLGSEQKATWELLTIIQASHGFYLNAYCLFNLKNLKLRISSVSGLELAEENTALLYMNIHLSWVSNYSYRLNYQPKIRKHRNKLQQEKHRTYQTSIQFRHWNYHIEYKISMFIMLLKSNEGTIKQIKIKRL